MAKKHPIEPLVDQVSEILNLYDQHLDDKIEGDLTPELVAMMANLEMRMGAAREALRLTMEKENLTELDLIKIVRNKERMPPQEKKILDRLAKLGNEVRTLHRAMERQVEADRQTMAKTGKKLKRRLGDSSTNLGIGFRKGWRKL